MSNLLLVLRLQRAKRQRISLFATTSTRKGEDAETVGNMSHVDVRTAGLGLDGGRHEEREHVEGGLIEKSGTVDGCDGLIP